MATPNPLAPLPEDRNMGHALVIVIAVLVIFTIGTTVLRLWVRGKRKVLGWDDYTIAVCCVLAVVRTIIQFISVHYGNGRHKVYVTAQNYQYINFLGYITQVLLFFNIGLLKCSICILILRIKDSPITKWSLYTMIVGLILTNGACMLILLAQCSPVKKYWIPTTPGTCWNVKIRIYSFYVQVVYSIITDFVCALLPVLVVWNLRIARSLKLAVGGLMSLGLVATACAIVRATSLNIQVTDMSYDYCIASIWASTELHLGIIATNLSLSRSIGRYFFSRDIFSSSNTQETKIGSNTWGYGGSNLSRLTSTETEVRDGSCQIELSSQVIQHTQYEVGDDNHISNEGYMTQKSWDQNQKMEKGVLQHGSGS